MDALTIRKARATEPGVAALVAAHCALMRASSPEESCHVQPADALARDGAVLFAAEIGGEVVGIGALKTIGAGHGEIKSMHTRQEVRGTGVARAILRHLTAEARRRGLSRLSLETGSADIFAPARTLYAGAGFRTCAPFADYTDDPLSTFMTCAL